jgi:glyceraldehyde-3-phosphate dehydrogenase/erythrose-4-phosphate dehydrogenase
MKIRIGLFGLGKTGRVVAQSLFQDDRFELAFAAKDQVLQSNEFEFVVKPKELIDELLN